MANKQVRAIAFNVYYKHESSSEVRFVLTQFFNRVLHELKITDGAPRTTVSKMLNSTYIGCIWKAHTVPIVSKDPSVITAEDVRDAIVNLANTVAIHVRNTFERTKGTRKDIGDFTPESRARILEYFDNEIHAPLVKELVKRCMMELDGVIAYCPMYTYIDPIE